MLNSILETRTMEDGMYNITLRINEDEYFSAYDYLDDEDACQLLDLYLKYRADDGRPQDIKLKHNKNEHIVTINASLSYLGNEKTEDMYNTHGYLYNNSFQ